jgi:putative tricarboxylic transport membrane protein
MKIRARLVAVSVTAALALGGTAFSPCPAAAEWKPQKPINVIIMAGKGGGADKLARLWQGIVQKHKLSPEPLIPINKGGGSGAEALRYMKDHQGSEYDVLVTLDSLYTTPIIVKGLDVDPNTMTPIRLMAKDTFLLWVTDPKIKTIGDYAAAVKAKGGNWKMGGTGSGQEDSLVTAMLAKAYGLKMTYVPYKSGGTVAAQLVGKHVDSTVNNPSEALGFYQAGKVHPIAAFTEAPMEGFPVPTFKKLGQDLVYYMDRQVVGPPGMSKDAQAFYIKLFQQVAATPEWQAYLKKNALVATDIEGATLHDYIGQRYELHKQLMSLWTNFNG